MASTDVLVEMLRKRVVNTILLTFIAAFELGAASDGCVLYEPERVIHSRLVATILNSVVCEKKGGEGREISPSRVGFESHRARF